MKGLTSKQEALLVEYQVCQREKDLQDRSYWTIFGFFISISTAVIGGIIAFGIKSIDFTKIHPIVLGIILFFIFMVFLVLVFLKCRYKRIQYLVGRYNNRIRDIEMDLKLGMENSILVFVSDNQDKFSPELKAKYKKYIEKLDKRDKRDEDQHMPSFTPPEYFSVKKLLNILIPLWAILFFIILGVMLSQLV